MITILVSMPIINIQAQAQSISNLDSWCVWMGDNEKNKKILQQMPLSSERSSHDSNSFKQFIFVLTTLFKFQVSFLGFCLVFFGNYCNFMLNDWRKCVHLGLSGDFNYTKVIVYGHKCRKQEAHFTVHKKVFPGFIHIWMASLSYWRQCYTECIRMFCGTFIYRTYNIKNTYSTSHHDSDVVQLTEIMFISHTSSFLVYIVVPLLTHTYGTVNGIFWSNKWENERWSVHTREEKTVIIILKLNWEACAHTNEQVSINNNKTEVQYTADDAGFLSPYTITKHFAFDCAKECGFHSCDLLPLQFTHWWL